jgi:hypothetical protein
MKRIKPRFDRITAYDINTGEIRWQNAHSSTPDDIENNPTLKGLDLPGLGQPGRAFVGVLATKTLLIAGKRGVQFHSEARGLTPRLPQDTGTDILGRQYACQRKTVSPMTYMHRASSTSWLRDHGALGGGELIAYALP